MEEKHVHFVVLSVKREDVLISNKRESLAQLHDEAGYLFHQPPLQFQLLHGLPSAKEAKIVTTAEHFIGIIGHRSRQCLVEIVGLRCGHQVAVVVTLHGVEQHVTGPTFGEYFYCIE